MNSGRLLLNQFNIFPYALDAASVARAVIAENRSPSNERSTSKPNHGRAPGSAKIAGESAA
jgi:hypothetical protein